MIVCHKKEIKYNERRRQTYDHRLSTNAIFIGKQHIVKHKNGDFFIFIKKYLRSTNVVSVYYW